MTAKRKRARRAPEHWPSPMWRVTIAEHDVPPRWHVEAQGVTVGASTAEVACNAAVRTAHIVAGVAPLHSLLALSMAHTTAESARSVAMRSEIAA
jgi:hypothetical protein